MYHIHRRHRHRDRLSRSLSEEGFFPKSRRPRAIIVQPTRELALQTIKVVRNFPVRPVGYENEGLINGFLIVRGFRCFSM